MAGPRQQRRWVMAAMVLGGAALAASGCGAKDCTNIGSVPSRVYLVVPDLATWHVQEMCIDDGCVQGFEVPVPDEPSTHSYRVTVVPPDGIPIVRTGEVTTIEVQPNGPGCPRYRAYARIRVADDGSVTTGWP